MRYGGEKDVKVLATAGLFALLLCFWPAGPRQANPAEELPTARPGTVRITVAAVGDLLMHLPIVNSVHDEPTDSYNFGAVFAPVSVYLSAADYTLANLETRLAGPANGYRGYPRLNTPADLAYYLRAAGVDLVATANNHSLDMGWDGIVATLDTLDGCGLAHVGTYRSAEEKAIPLIVDVGGVRLGILNYTASTNGLPVPPGKDFAVNVISPGAIEAEARAARAWGADLVVAILHFGDEYQRRPDADQRRLVEELVRNGVDVIVGAHSHVVQPIERISVPRDGKPYSAVVAYSLGNFLSNQRDRYRDSGIILYLEIEKSEQGTTVQGVRYLPVWVQKRQAEESLSFRILPVHPQISPATDVTPSAADQQRMDQVWREMSAQLNNPAADIRPVDAKVFSAQTPP
jgi:poly-gamma-glutamate synthesis protein (capsule biosynthesis protein)